MFPLYFGIGGMILGFHRGWLQFQRVVEEQTSCGLRDSYMRNIVLLILFRRVDLSSKVLRFRSFGRGVVGGETLEEPAGLDTSGF